MARTAGKLRSWWFAGALALIGPAGCGSPNPPAAEPSRAHDALRAALDAWKAGETPEALSKRTPSIHVSDTDWKGGFRLIGYQAGEAGRLVGFDMTYPVVLELKDRKGRSVKKTAVYTVSTNPQLLVLRQEG
jgi:hypothetical protein